MQVFAGGCQTVTILIQLSHSIQELGIIYLIVELHFDIEMVYPQYEFYYALLEITLIIKITVCVSFIDIL